MKRRDVLKLLLSTTVSASFLNRPAHADFDGRVLIVVFMRGGWDGLNIVVPYGDDTYYSLRPTIAIQPPGSSGAVSAIDIDGFFGFHPSMKHLHNLYQAGHVAVMPAVHYSDSSYSHFKGQDIVESASMTSHDSGWLGRYLVSSGGESSSKGLGLGEQIPVSLRGLPTPVSAFPNLASLQITDSWIDRQMISGVVERAYQSPPVQGNPHANLLHAIGGRLISDLSKLREIGQTPAGNGATYPSGTFGGQLRQAAALVKAKIGLRVITIDLGGWDTHSGQGGGQADGRMSRLLAGFSESVSAFFTDLGADASQVTLLTMSEFGRTAAENGSGGTDHGNASTWMAIGPTVNGGMHLGNGWPGLQPSQLRDGRALAHTIDFRAIYANVLTRCLGATNLSAVLPGYGGGMVDVVV